MGLRDFGGPQATEAGCRPRVRIGEGEKDEMLGQSLHEFLFAEAGLNGVFTRVVNHCDIVIAAVRAVRLRSFLKSSRKSRLNPTLEAAHEPGFGAKNCIPVRL